MGCRTIHYSSGTFRNGTESPFLDVSVRYVLIARLEKLVQMECIVYHMEKMRHYHTKKQRQIWTINSMPSFRVQSPLNTIYECSLHTNFINDDRTNSELE